MIKEPAACASPLWRLFLAILLLCIGMERDLQAQDFEISPVSSQYLNDADYDSLILRYAVPVAVSHGISPNDFNTRYPTYRHRFSEIIKAILQNPYHKLDQTYSGKETAAGSKEFLQARSRYLGEAAKGIELALGNISIFYPLFDLDYSDRILSFYSEIKVQQNGEMLVTETIRIFNGNGESGKISENQAYHSDNDDIKRGIIRDFPTKYKDKNGYWSSTEFHLKAVYKNGRPENYETESLSNGIRVKIGRKEVLLDTGIFVYRIEYRTSRQLIFHPDKDELYWNVNGNGWVFTADSVSCRVEFPEGANILENACYTGVQGSTDRNCVSTPEAPNRILFSGTMRFKSYEGLTVAVAIGKGIIQAPGKLGKMSSFLADNFIIPLLSLVLLALTAFYYYFWRRYGRDPKMGTIIPRFEPPSGFSAADTGYVLEQSYKPRFFAAALVEAAVHRHLEIEVAKKGILFKSPQYTFRKPEEIDSAELAGIGNRYGFSLPSIYGEKAESGHYNPTLKSVYESLDKHLQEKFRKKRGNWKGLFTLNRGYVMAGYLILIASVVSAIFFVLNHYSFPLLVISASLLVAILVVHMVFSKIMSAYSAEGRQIADQILGFKMYLGTAEQPYYNQMTPPEKDLALFEAYLPYAIALNVENAWADKFDEIIRKAIEEGYHPGYYNSRGGLARGFSMSGFTQSISSGLSSTISSASTPPSSSGGGSGGGGSSGGGGGGGGGGGW